MRLLSANLLVILLSVFLGGGVLAQQTKADVKTMLEERDEEIKELVGPKGTEYTESQRKELKDIINGVIDFRAMAQQALAETYDTLADNTREEFVDLFATIVRDQSLNKLDIYRAKVVYTSVTVDGNIARVETTAQLEDVRTPVNYDLEYKNGKWMVTDLEIDDVSTAESYNTQFQRIINKKGFDSLMESLRKRAARG